jgi:hypothetical protein
MQFRSCGSCNACCEGNLWGNAYGSIQTHGTACRFLVDKKCSIYSTRPGFCAGYQCGWTQGILDDSMRPDLSGLLINIETDSDGVQYWHVTETKPDVPWSNYQAVDEFAKKYNTKWVLRKYHALLP